MGEIKSTLELVMQRTRNLSLSDEEKDAQKRTDFTKNLNGLVQRFEDGQLRRHEIDREIDRLHKAYGISEKQVLLNGLAERIGLERDNRPVLGLLEQICRMEVGTIAAVLSQYRDAIQEGKERHAEAARDKLLTVHHISGSAVVGLPGAGSGWHVEAAALRSKFQDRLKQAITEMKAKKLNAEG